MIAFDTETYLTDAGPAVPKLVVASIYDPAEGKPKLLLAWDAIQWFREWLDGDESICGANIAFDMGVMANADPEFIPLIFKAYDEGRISDTSIRATLDAIAKGLLRKEEGGPTELIDPRTMQPCRDPEKGKVTDRFSLALTADLFCGVLVQKADTWRKRYALLDGVPLAQWPADAKAYALTDAEITYRVWATQEGLMPINPALLQVYPEWKMENLCDEYRQVYAAWCMHLGGVWGLRTDPARVAELKAKIDAKHEQDIKQFTALGLIRPDGSKDTGTLARMVATSYGASGICPRCKGNGKVPSAKTGKPVICKPSELDSSGCCGTGLDLEHAPPGLPRTPKDGLSLSRDTLLESGNETLMEFAYVSENEKLRNTYLPFLERGCVQPLSLRPNSLLATGRSSYEGLIQLLPRGHGIREAFRFRDGFVGCSVDYSALEFCTLGQACLDLVGWSEIASSLQAGRDPHIDLACQLLGTDYDDAWTRYKAKDKAVIDARQAAKAGNFGFGGGMGPAKFVLAKRREAGETIGPDGKEYKGLRLCIISGRSTRCGVETVQEWNGRALPPTCKECILFAVELRSAWMKRWREMSKYFEIISGWTEGEFGGTIEQLRSGRLRGGLTYSAGANTIFQGLAADGAKAALVRLTKECMTDRKSPLYGSRPIVFVHDEIIAELREDVMHDAAMRMAEIMRETMHEWTPDVPIKAEPALMRYWYKKAEPVYDAQGRLIPWEPEPKKKAA